MMKFVVVLILIFFSINLKGQDIPRWKIADLQEFVQNSGKDVLVLNIWATFCKPCVAEIPGFIRIAEKYKKSVQLQLVSVDLKTMYPEKIQEFLEKHKFDVASAWLDETNADYFCPKVDSSWSGSIPATLIINQKTGYRKFFEEEIDEKILEEEIQLAIGSKAEQK